MKKIKLSCFYDGEYHDKEIECKHVKSWYKKNTDRSFYLLGGEDKRPRVHPEMLDQVARDIAFIDRSGLIAAKQRHGFHNLSGEKGYHYSRPPNGDHVTDWRKEGEKDICLVISEPYDSREKHWLEWHEEANERGLCFAIFNPSKESLWNPNSYMVFWWCPEYYEPDFDILIPGQKQVYGG